MGKLRDVFEPLRKIFLPTPEEMAAQEKAHDVDKYSYQLQQAIKGHKMVQDERYMPLETLFLMTEVKIAPVYSKADWTAEEQVAEIQAITERLQALGVDSDQIDALKAQACGGAVPSASAPMRDIG
ncbi:MAG: hypothetical protein CMH27_03320 [Micavibrio sp.]|nr:hypothetical protein [Micavibrio sp.]|tara:strand:- start:80 stop:457 length:378 start_codon:yes stop_codon:yes gene_type:complete